MISGTEFPRLGRHALDVAGMEVSYSESGLQTNAISSYSWDCLALQCQNVDDHTCPGEMYCVYTHGFCARLSTFHGNNT